MRIALLTVLLLTATAAHAQQSIVVNGSFLGMNRWALIDGDGKFNTRTANDKEPKRTFTLQDTGGCSCTQLIEKLGLGEGHRKHGCSTGEMEQWIKSLKQ